MELSGSIVLYNSNYKVLKMAVDSFLTAKLNSKLYLIDNSPYKLQYDYFINPRIEYIFNGKNLGFGKAHNIALKRALDDNSKYHLVLNPDVYFGEGTLEKLFYYMEKNISVGQLMPTVLFPNGSIQYLCKLLPTPSDLFLRRFFNFNKKKVEQNNYRYELRFTNYDSIMNVPYLSGCFMFLRMEVLKNVGLFDERIFMYIEDTDLTRRIHKFYQTTFFPDVSIYHHYAKGSYKNLKLMLYNIHGAIVYFNKWGWFFDRERDEMNKKVLIELKYESKKNHSAS